MTFLEHGDIRKSGRAILIACTIFVLLNECSEAFEKVVLFGFEVRITHEMLLGFLRVGTGALSLIFVVRFVQDYAAWENALSGKKAAEVRQGVLINEVNNSFTTADKRKNALKKIGRQSIGIEHPDYARIQGEKKLINSEYLRFYFRRLGDQTDALLLQVILPVSAVIYAFWLSPALTLVCEAV